MSSDHSPSPIGPVAATLAAVIHQDRILLIRRANRPDAGRWAFPGGKIRAGETIMAAAHRELTEETGVQGQAMQLFDALDVFDREPSARPVAYSHFILIAVLFRWQQGEPQAGDDALDARWFSNAELDSLDVAHSFDVVRVARRALALATTQDQAGQA
ncbi:NUDIX hydrolase [Alcaligenes nematophilus]|uniref:NUDIX hydrolase n=1 Tax=Alcaligenes nematophilus TaxID=2994643 RepID=UPI0034E0BD54